MTTGIRHLHSLLAVFVLLVLIIAFVKAFIGWRSKKPYTAGDNRIAVFGLAFTHLQFLLGLVLLFTAGYFANDMGTIMRTPTLRFMAVEHPITMLLAAIMVTIGRVQSKKVAADNLKHAKVALFYGIGLALVLTRVPWATWSLFN